MPQQSNTEFPKRVIETLAKRVSYICSNPKCNRPTSGPHSDKDKSLVVGKAAHIRGQRRGGPRYDENMSDEERRDIANGIWLCAICHDKVDKDEAQYTVDVLIFWKKSHEEKIDLAMSGSPATPAKPPDLVASDKNLKDAMDSWQKGDINGIINSSWDAYYHSTGPVKLQAISNLVIFSHEDITKAGFYIGLCDEGIALASSLKDLATRAVLKAHKTYYLQNRAFATYMEVLAEKVVNRGLGIPGMSDLQLNNLREAVKKDMHEVSTLGNESQDDAIQSNNRSAVADVKMTIGGVAGLSYFLFKQLGKSTGEIEHVTIQLLKESKEIYESIGDRHGSANALHNLANNLRFFGDTAAAEKLSLEALKIAKEINYKELEGKALELLDRLKDASTDYSSAK